jgi:formate dehydrogenase gamma subunit
MTEQKQYTRFTVPQRIEHWVLTISFTALAVTGLPQKFAGDGWAERLIGLMGGIEMVRTIHHWAAIVMTLEAIYHVTVVAYKIFVLRVRWSMFPRLDDLIDGIDAIRYNLGLAKERPKLDRFSFEEKMEYWAVVWGTAIMALTGFIMWNPISAARVLPGDLIPASKAAHGGEAVLAVLAIIVWHFYNVHVKTFNKVVFTGKLSEHQMREEHALELERLRQGKVDPRPAPEVTKKRERVFIPVATIAAVVMLVALYFVTSYENTALTTLPRHAQGPLYAPITPTPTVRAPAATPAPTSVAAVKPLPANHEGRTTCLSCHTTLPQPALPADHAGRSDTTCTACHKAGSALAATPTPSTGSAGTGVAKPLPASHTGRTTCVACHANNIGPVNPPDHAGRTDATCTACHKAP